MVQVELVAHQVQAGVQEQVVQQGLVVQVEPAVVLGLLGQVGHLASVVLQVVLEPQALVGLRVLADIAGHQAHQEVQGTMAVMVAAEVQALVDRVAAQEVMERQGHQEAVGQMGVMVHLEQVEAVAHRGPAERLVMVQVAQVVHPGVVERQVMTAAMGLMELLVHQVHQERVEPLV